MLHRMRSLRDRHVEQEEAELAAQKEKEKVEQIKKEKEKEKVEQIKKDKEKKYDKKKK